MPANPRVRGSEIRHILIDADDTLWECSDSLRWNVGDRFWRRTRRNPAFSPAPVKARRYSPVTHR
jgi:hypothetical protein